MTFGMIPIVQLCLTKSRVLLLLTSLNLTTSHMPKESKPEALWRGSLSNPQVNVPLSMTSSLMQWSRPPCPDYVFSLATEGRTMLWLQLTQVLALYSHKERGFRF